MLIKRLEKRGEGKGIFAVARLGIFFYANSEKTQKTLRDQRMAGSDFRRKVFRLFWVWGRS
jgi:hypothetical protein